MDVNGAAVRGHVAELDPPSGLVLTWVSRFWRATPPGVSTVEVSISRHNGGTSVEIVHSGLTQPESSRHVAGWRHFLERVAQTVERQGVENSKGR